jgi:hypothetical protein
VGQAGRGRSIAPCPTSRPNAGLGLLGLRGDVEDDDGRGHDRETNRQPDRPEMWLHAYEAYAIKAQVIEACAIRGAGEARPGGKAPGVLVGRT